MNLDTSNFVTHIRKRDDKSSAEEWLFDPETYDMYLLVKNCSSIDKLPTGFNKIAAEKDGKIYVKENGFLNSLEPGKRLIIEHMIDHMREQLIKKLNEH